MAADKLFGDMELVFASLRILLEQGLALTYLGAEERSAAAYPLMKCAEVLATIPPA